jgi:hypothetical protein
MPLVHVTLLTHHDDYLRRKAGITGVSISSVLGAIIEASHIDNREGMTRLSRKKTRHISLSESQTDILNRFANRSGRRRSEAVRRLIDAAQMAEASNGR